MPDADHIQVTNFKGLNTAMPPDLIDDAEFQILQNAVYKNGAWEKRRALGAFSNFEISETLHCVGMCSDFDPTRVFVYLFDAENHSLYCSDYNPEPSAIADLTLLSNDVKIVCTNILSTGAGAYLVYQKQSDSTYDLVVMQPTFGGPLAFQHIDNNISSDDSDGSPCWLFGHQDRLWLLTSKFTTGLDFFGSTLSYTDPGDWTVLDNHFDSTRFVQIEDSLCTEAVPLNDKILIFGHTGGIWELDTQGSPSAWDLRHFNSDYNIPQCRRLSATLFDSDLDTRNGFHQATLKFRGIVYFLAIDGLYVTDGVDVRKLSDAIDNYINITLTPTGTGDPSQIFTEFPGLCLMDEVNNYLIIKVTYDSQYAPKYFVYGIDDQVWSELIYAAPVPGSAPVLSAPYASLYLGSGPYPYTFESMFYISISNADTSLPGGLFMFSNSHLIEKNKGVRYRATDRDTSRYGYFDGRAGDSYSFITKYRSKNFDFGFRGINKKNSKIYLTFKYVFSILGNFGHTTPVKIIRYCNDNPLSDIDIILDTDKRHFKVAGVGYFIENSLEISDEDDVNRNFWSLQSFAFDMYNKPEQLNTVGNN